MLSGSFQTTSEAVKCISWCSWSATFAIISGSLTHALLGMEDMTSISAGSLQTHSRENTVAIHSQACARGRRCNTVLIRGGVVEPACRNASNEEQHHRAKHCLGHRGALCPLPSHSTKKTEYSVATVVQRFRCTHGRPAI